MNNGLWKGVNEYLKIEVFGKRVAAPYYTNYVGRKTIDTLLEYGLKNDRVRDFFKIYNSNKDIYGLYRGKASAPQIKSGIEKIAKEKDLDLTTASEKGILALMYDYGLGVDCSGFVFNILFPIYGNRLLDILDWGKSPRKDVFRAKSSVFAGQASHIVSVNNIKHGDLILLKKQNDYSHVALVLEKAEEFWVAQSTSTIWPMGVHVHKFNVINSIPSFSFKPDYGKSWEEKFKLGDLEFRRLSIETH